MARVEKICEQNEHLQSKLTQLVAQKQAERQALEVSEYMLQDISRRLDVKVKHIPASIDRICEAISAIPEMKKVKQQRSNAFSL